MKRPLPKTAGLILAALISMAVLTAFYGNLFPKLNRVCFASGGDGLQSFINMDYHIRVDSSYMRCNSMDYPYGEHIFFTNIQPLICNTIKFISQNIIDISDYTFGIVNFLLLFCLVITPLILYLILTEIGIGAMVSVLASVGITYLSPQLDRFGGHFTLSYVCIIPLMIYLVMRFFRKPGFLLTGLIFLTAMAAALTHFYLYGFLGVMLLFFYGAYFAGNEPLFSKKYIWAVHLFIQLILPFIILQAFYISDHVTDRPGYPWGFLYYRAYPQSIFLPWGKPYGRFLYSLVNTNFIDWEGFAFVGLLATAGTAVFLVRFLRNALRWKLQQIFHVTSNRQVNILFWASLLMLLYSFGLPFILGLEWLINLIGPIRQMRGIARFSWLFYYVMNIVTVYWLWENWKKANRKNWAMMLLIVSLAVLWYDAYFQVRNRGKGLENNIPALVDKDLRLPENQWIRRHDLSRYQAIIPMPYYHIGSENIWIDGGCEIVPASFIAIKNSRLPSMAVMLNRTSISQTIENVSLMLGPSSGVLNLGRFPSKKPFLLMAARCDLLSEHERQMIAHSRWIDSTGNFDLYEMPFRAFTDIADSMAKEIAGESTNAHLFGNAATRSSDSLLTYRFVNFDSLAHSSSLDGTQCFEGKAKIRNVLFRGSIPKADTSRLYYVSFWMNNVRSDLYPRTNVFCTETDTSGNIINAESFAVFKKFVQIVDNWALVQIKLKMHNPLNKMEIAIQNSMLENNLIQVDNLLIIPEKSDLYYRPSNGLLKNNRFYLKEPDPR